MYAQQAPPHHLHPAPRPAIPGTTFDSSDLFVALWAPIWIGLAAFSVWYAIAGAHYPDEITGAWLASGGFSFMSVVFVVWWVFRIRRRIRVFTHGRAVQGYPFGDVNVQVINRFGERAGKFKLTRIGFEDKYFVVGHGVFSPNPIIYINGSWAGLVENGRPFAKGWLKQPR